MNKYLFLPCIVYGYNNKIYWVAIAHKSSVADSYFSTKLAIYCVCAMNCRMLFFVFLNIFHQKSVIISFYCCYCNFCITTCLHLYIAFAYANQCYCLYDKNHLPVLMCTSFFHILSVDMAVNDLHHFTDWWRWCGRIVAVQHELEWYAWHHTVGWLHVWIG